MDLDVKMANDYSMLPRGVRAQTVRISIGFGLNMLPLNSERPRESPRPVADRERPVRMLSTCVFVNPLSRPRLPSSLIAM
jgi:hypothetical protein